MSAILSMSISDACTCRVQASVRLLKMLRHIIGKEMTSAALALSSSCMLFFLASLSQWILSGILGALFFLDFLGLLQVIRLRFPARSFSMTRAHVLRCCKADFGRWRWGDGGVKVGGLAPSMGLSWIVIPFNPPLSSLCNYNAHVIWIVQKRTKKSKRPKSTLAADVSSNTSILPEIYPDTNRLWVHPLTSQAHHLAMDSIPWKSKCFRHTDWIYNAHMLLELMLAIKALRVGFHGKQPERG